MYTITNLIHDRWIPVRCRDGTTKTIAPWEMTADHENNPTTAIVTLRPDFDGALTQYLIGLCQTVIPPADEEEWRELLFEPPEPSALKKEFDKVAGAFNLYGDGPRFMQETSINDGTVWSVRDLIIGMPEDTKISENTDWFVKRDTLNGLCPACAAMALYTLQTNAPGGGRGHMTSMRGGGPMTTIVLGPTLWQTVWANVLDRDDEGEKAKAEDDRRFPWMGRIRTSEGKEVTTPTDAHPDQAFWGMPRRVLLDFDGATPGTCDLCGEETDTLVTRYHAKPYGIKYAGWVHPLSPYYRKDKKSTEMLPLHPQPGGITYQNWLGMVINDRKEGATIAENIALFPRRTPPGRVREVFAPNGSRPRLWAFGFDMDNKKPRCYYQGTMPIISAAEESRAELEDLAAGMIKSATEMANNVRWCVKVALFDKPADVKGDLSVITARFYQATEKDFYRSLEDAVAILGKGGNTAAIRREWYETLKKEGEHLFDEYSQIDIIDEIDARRAVNARKLLRNPFSKANKAVKGHLGIPDPKKQKGKEKP